MSPDAWRLLGIVAGVVVVLIGAIYGLLLWEIRRVGRGVHSLRTQVGELILPIEKDVRELQRKEARIEGRLEEASGWRTMVLELIRMVLEQVKTPPKS